MDSAQNLQSEWAKGQCPIFNGIILANGTCFPFKINLDRRGTPPEHVYDFRLVALPERQFSDVSEEIIGFASIFTLDSAQFGTQEAKVGAGAFEEEGFVALENDTGLVWVAYFDESDSFVKVAVTGEGIVATSEVGFSLCFPIDAPQKVYQI